MQYPIWDIAIGGGMLMAVVAIAHVIVSHFAIGGGLVIAVTETIAVSRGDHEKRELARRGSLMLILISTVFGAISGVGIWVVAGLISPGAISALIHTYVWGWAIEWTFFVVEIIAALVYYATWNKISKRAHVMVAWVYFAAAYMSLFVINGIITFMLTPGRWLETRAFWDGFFNPTCLPSLVLRTGITVIMAAAFLIFVTQKAAREARTRLVRYMVLWLIAGALVAYAGYRWWEASLPETVLGLFRGDPPLMTTLASTRSLALWALAATLVLAVVLLVKMPRAVRISVAVVTAVAAFTFFGGYERLREGTRKPFLIHSHMFSNGLLIDDIERINETGLSAHSGWVALRSEDAPEVLGREIFKVQCSSCHTVDGYQAIRPLLPSTADLAALAADDPPGTGEKTFESECVSCHSEYTYDELREMSPGADEIQEDPGYIKEIISTMIAGTLERLRDMGNYYTAADRTRMVNTHETDYPLMPPLVGLDDDLGALAAYLISLERPYPDDARAESGGGE